MKKATLIFLSMIMFVFSISGTTLTTYGKTLDTSTKYEVFNGHGELIYIADTLEDAEFYMANIDNNDRSAGAVWKVAKTVFQKAATPIMITCIVYRVGDWLLSDGEVLDIINEIVPIRTLMEIAELGEDLFIYSRSNSLSNPYPPNSYEGAMWVSNNYYYVRGTK